MNTLQKWLNENYRGVDDEEDYGKEDYFISELSDAGVFDAIRHIVISSVLYEFAAGSEVYTTSKSKDELKKEVAEIKKYLGATHSSNLVKWAYNSYGEEVVWDLDYTTRGSNDPKTTFKRA